MKRRIVKLSLACCLLTYAHRDLRAQVARWVRVQTGDSTALFVDSQSAHPGPAGTREVWFKLEHPRERADTVAESRVIKYRSELWYYRFNCTARTYAHLRRMLYSADGNSVGETDFTDVAIFDPTFTRQRTVVPETNMEMMMRAGCAAQLHG